MNSTHWRQMQLAGLSILVGCSAAIGILFLPWYNYADSYFNGFGHALVGSTVDVLAPEWQPIVTRISVAFALSLVAMGSGSRRRLARTNGWLSWLALASIALAILLLLLVLLTFSQAYNDPEHTLATHIAFIAALVVAVIGNVGLFFAVYSSGRHG